MKRILIVLLISIVTLACSNESYDVVSVDGVWRLTAYSVDEGFDINNDGIKSVNLLEEIECTNSETLIFEPNGVISSNKTFNPKIDVALNNEDSTEYTFNVECDLEGVIGFATNYTQKDNIVTFNNKHATLMNNQLFVVFKDAIEIFDADHAKILSTQDLTLVYTKQ